MGERFPPSFSSRALNPRISGEVSGDRVATLATSDLGGGVEEGHGRVVSLDWNVESSLSRGQQCIHASTIPYPYPKQQIGANAFVAAGSAMAGIVGHLDKGHSIPPYPQPTPQINGPAGNTSSECMQVWVAGHYPLEPRRTTSLWCKGGFPVRVVFLSMRPKI
jgi:hypothetical protein